jgi:glycosyltransferase involved in cell wall biosynthesis
VRVAIVHDWFISGHGGAELVAYELSRMFPEAPVYASYCSDEWRERLAPSRVVTGFLQRWPWPALRKYVPFLRAWWFSRLRLDGYDLVISSSGAEAKGVRVPQGTRHIAYIHAPTHYYWDRYEAYLREPGFGWFNWAARLGLRVLVGPLRRWDYRAAQRPDHLIANSTHTQAMIRKYYGRDSTVIFPPVDTAKYQIPNTKSQKPRRGFIVVGRQAPYKRIDLAVAACTRLKLPLTVVGDGPEHERLLRMAGPTVIFMRDVSEDEKIKLLQTNAAFIFPNEDDFGISAVEAMAAGCPVIALKAGGALDTVEPGVSGEFFDEPTVESLVKALKNFHPTKYTSSKIINHATQFSARVFTEKLRAFLKISKAR